MQRSPNYRDVVAEVSVYLQDQFAACLASGIDANRLLRSGFGFEKHGRLALLRAVPVSELSCHWLTRKTMVGGSWINQSVAGYPAVYRFYC